jgi:hypothetical protein
MPGSRRRSRSTSTTQGPAGGRALQLSRQTLLEDAEPKRHDDPHRHKQGQDPEQEGRLAHGKPLELEPFDQEPGPPRFAVLVMFDDLASDRPRWIGRELPVSVVEARSFGTTRADELAFASAPHALSVSTSPAYRDRRVP